MQAVTPLPEKFGRYRVLRKLGAGGMGTVYLAHDTELDRDVALKVPHFSADDDPEVVERFKREARIAAGTHHSNVCPVYDVGEIDGVHYLTMPYIEGAPLSQRVGKPWPPLAAVTLVSRLASVLAVLHKRNLMHRDLKPANIMLRPGDDPVVMDFGLARSATGTDRMTATGAAVGTPAYMSPEQIKGDPGKVGPATDIFSLGIIFYELLTGQSPFPGPGHVCCYHIVHEDPALPSRALPGLDAALDALCLKALEKNPAKRYASMADFAAALDDYRRQLGGGGAETLVKSGGAAGQTLVKSPAPETDLMPVPCPSCGKRLQVPASLWGKKVRCPQCKTTFPVTDVPTLTPSPVPLTAAEQVTPPPSSHETVRNDPPPRRGLPALVGGAALAALCLAAGVGLAFAWHGSRGKVRDELVVAQLPAEPLKPTILHQETTPQAPPPRPAEPQDEPPEIIPPPSDAEPKPAPRPPVEPKADPPQQPVVLPVEPKADTPKQTETPKAEVPRPEVPKPEVPKKVEPPTETPERPPAPQPRPEPEPVPATPQKEITNSIGMKLVLVPAGTFRRGSVKGQDEFAYRDEFPQNNVTVKRPFRLAAHKTTQEQFDKVMGRNPSWFAAAGGGKDRVPNLDTARFPVESVSFFDAADFCNRLSEREGLTPRYTLSKLRREAGSIKWAELDIARDAAGYRLPSEAEWEYCARAGTTTRFWFGDNPEALDQYAWYSENSGGRTQPVGGKPANRWGLYDLGGLANEWCEDLWHPNYDGAPADGSAWLSGGEPGQRVVRGGAWNSFAKQCRCPQRLLDTPGHRYYNLGFRVVLPVAPAEPEPVASSPPPPDEPKPTPPEPAPVAKKQAPAPEPERVAVTSAGVSDRAGMFGAEAVKLANARIMNISQHYKTPVIVETLAKLPGNKSAEVAAMSAADRRKYISRLAREWAHESRLDGIYVLICRRPGYVQIVVGPETLKKAFSAADRDELLEVLLTGMRSDQHDDALAKGLDLIVARLRANREAAAKATPATARPKEGSSPPQHHAPVARPNRQ